MKSFRTLVPAMMALAIAAAPAAALAKLYVTSKTLMPLPSQRFLYCSRYNESTFACDDRVTGQYGHETLYFVEVRDQHKGCAVVPRLENPAPFKFSWHVRLYSIGGERCAEHWSNNNTVHVNKT